MKGRQLTLQEVLKLEDGTKVWVEEFEDYKPRLFKLRNCLCKKINGRLDEVGTNLCSRLSNLDGTENRQYYEWIEEKPKEIISTYKSVSEIMESMATDICNLRGIDLTEDNIDKIMKEFVQKE